MAEAQEQSDDAQDDSGSAVQRDREVELDLVGQKEVEIQRLQAALQDALGALLRQTGELRAAQDAALSLSCALEGLSFRPALRFQPLEGNTEEALLRHPKRLLCAEVLEQRLEMHRLKARLRTERSFLLNARREAQTAQVDNDQLRATIDRQNDAIQFLAKALKQQVHKPDGNENADGEHGLGGLSNGARVGDMRERNLVGSPERALRFAAAVSKESSEVLLTKGLGSKTDQPRSLRRKSASLFHTVR